MHYDKKENRNVISSPQDPKPTTVIEIRNGVEEEVAEIAKDRCQFHHIVQCVQ
jgi:hypothetical protein